VVDANACHKLVSDHEDGSKVLAWLLKGRGRLVVSKALLGEISMKSFGSLLLALDQAGRLFKADDDACDASTAQLKASGQLKSNDAHVVSLVINSPCDVVFTHDQPLHADLKNKNIVPNGCSIYQSANHQHLLGECLC
jgi:predicted nucleic acid-binding protein